MGKQSAAIAARLASEISNVTKAFVVEVDANLRKAPDQGGTPIDVGHARANWVPSVGAPATAEVSGNAAHDAGVAAVLAYKLGNGDVFLSNNAPYIGLLNLGHSTQAPAGFVEAAIDQAKATIEQRYGVAIDVTTTGAGSFSDAAGGYAASNLARSYSPFGGDA